MSWSATVQNVQEYEKLDPETEEYFSSQHAAYPRDFASALQLAKSIGLKSATLSGGRTPNPYGGDEIIDVSVRGTPVYNDFLLEMREIIGAGPDISSDINRHYEALARLRIHPCSHVFVGTQSRDDMPALKQCLACHVFLNGTMFFFEE